MKFDAVVSHRAFQKLNLRDIVEAAPRLNTITITWLLFQKVLLEKDHSSRLPLRLRETSRVHGCVYPATLRRGHPCVMWDACALAVSYHGKTAICNRILDPAPTCIVRRLLSNQLPLACYYGNEDCVRSLIAQGEDVNIEDEFLVNPLFAATLAGRDAIFDLLLNHQANPNIGAALLVAAHNQNAALVQSLLRSSEVDPNHANWRGQTALWWSCFAGHSSIVRLLLHHPKTDVNLRSLNQSPLTVAAGKGHETIVRWLLGRADLRIDLKNGLSCPVWYATYMGQTQVLQLLLDKLKMGPDDYGLHSRTLLWWAAQQGHASIVQMLLGRNDVNPNYHSDAGTTPLREAARNGHHKVVELLLQREDLDPNIRSYTDDTPLCVAVNKGHENVVRSLLGCRAVRLYCLPAKKDMKLSSGYF